MGRLLGRLVVFFTTALIFFISYTPQIFIIWPWYGREFSIELFTLLVPFNILVGILLYNYYLCIVTDPGVVPHNWEPEFDDTDGYEVKKLSGAPRYCRMCKRYKPPRAHHCKTCKRCVLRMDHHCPWVNNCVGFYNYGHFIRFLFFVDLSCTYHVTMVTRRVFDTIGKRYWDSSDTGELLWIVLNFATCVPVLLLVGGFSLYHFYSLLGNTTTIEAWEKDKVATLIRRGKIREVKFPYNLGARRNVESMLGTNPLLWWCPNVGPLGTGLKYQLAEWDGIERQQVWPPPDPTEYNGGWTQPASPWTYDNGGPNPALTPSNSSSAQHLRSRKRDAAGLSAVPPYHPDYDESAQHEYGDGEVDYDYDDGERFAEYEEVRQRMPFVRRGSEGYEVRPIDREQLLAEYIADRAQEDGHYYRYVPEPPSDHESEGESGREEGEEVGAEVEVEVEVGRVEQDDHDDGDEEPLAVRVEKWRSGEAIS